MTADFTMLQGLLEELTECRLARNPNRLWEGSSYGWLTKLPSRKRQAVGKQLVAGWSAAKGLDVIRAKDSPCDRVIAGQRMEIKFSTLWGSGVYKFQQLREQNYEFAICLGLSPFTAHCWVISKDLLRAHVIGHTPQHTGKGGTDTFWLSVDVANPPSWLSECGGTLALAFRVLKSISRK